MKIFVIFTSSSQQNQENLHLCLNHNVFWALLVSNDDNLPRQINSHVINRDILISIFGYNLERIFLRFKYKSINAKVYYLFPRKIIKKF